MKSQLSGPSLLRHAGVRLRLLFRPRAFRLTGLAGAAALAAALLILALQSHTSQPEEIVKVDAEDRSPVQGTADEHAADGETAESQPSANPPTIEKAARLDVGGGDHGTSEPDSGRWAARDPRPPAEAARALEESLASGTEEAIARRGTSATPSDEGPDPVTTSALSTGDMGAAAEVAIAESEVEIAELEGRLAVRDGEAFAMAAAADDDHNADMMAQFGGDAPQGIVTSYVNLRAEPDNDAEILRVVPENAYVALLDGCPNWCEVEHEGFRGFIYGSFVDRRGAAEPSEPESAP